MRRLPRLVDEQGVSIVMVALSMLLLMGVSAVVVDLAAIRFDIRADRLASDAASTAGASEIEPFAGSQADTGCETAWEYALANLEDEDSFPSDPDCSVFTPPCDPDGSARTTTGFADPYAITITHPIPNDHDLVTGQSINAEFDGVQCQRLGVTIERTRDYTFAAVLGFDIGTTEVSSVARVKPDGGEGDVVPLVVLEPHGCDALTADGQGKITVTHFEDSPGLIVTDSDGSGADCGASAPYIIEVQAEGNKRWIRALPVPPDEGGAQSAILSYALSGQPGSEAGRAYNPDDLTTEIDTSYPGLTGPEESYFQLYPRPIFKSQRVTRAPIDHRYNCKDTYPDYLGVSISPCLGPDATHIDGLDDAYGDPPGFVPVGMARWSEIQPDCMVNAGELIAIDSTDTLGRDLWIDCAPQLDVLKGTVRIDGVNVLFDGDLDVGSDGVFEVNTSDTGDYWVFFRDGGDLLKVAQGSISLNRTFVYLQNGIVDLVGGDGGLVWTAPTEKTYRFEDIALWGEKPDQFELGGQSGNTLTGTFFTPYANPFTLKGQAGQLQTDAQFVTRRLVVSGFTEVLMKPDPETSTKFPVRGVSLIR